MAMPKILPPRPTGSSKPRSSFSASSYSHVIARASSPPRPIPVAPPVLLTNACESQNLGKIALVRSQPSKPPPPTPIRAELRSQDFEEVVEAAPESASEIAPSEIADPIDVLFEAMEDLFSVETSIEAGAICLASLIRAIPCRGGIVHLYDAESREFVAVFALGPRAEHLVLTRADESDELISASFRKHHPIVVDYRAPNGAHIVDRHVMLDASQNAIVCPIVDGARFLGAIELVDAKNANGFDTSAEHGISYVAERYAGFLAEHGVVLANVVAPPSGFIS
jgi:hypothetical protein